MEFRSHLMDQIEKAARLIATLMGVKKLDNESQRIDQELSELTGLNATFFVEDNATLLGVVLQSLADNNQKAVVAQLLLIKNPQIYRSLYEQLINEIDFSMLSPKVKALLNDKVVRGERP